VGASTRSGARLPRRTWPAGLAWSHSRGWSATTRRRSRWAATHLISGDDPIAPDLDFKLQAAPGGTSLKEALPQQGIEFGQAQVT
jgi:hypothetical protein